MMRKLLQAKPAEIEEDFQRRVFPGVNYCQRVGNIMGATMFLSLASTIDNGQFFSPRRIGCFSYGSGCCSEFYSGVVTSEGQERQRHFAIKRQLDERYLLSMEEYESIIRGSGAVSFGTRNVQLDKSFIAKAYQASSSKGRLFLNRIKEFHREYEWLS